MAKTEDETQETGTEVAPWEDASSTGLAAIEPTGELVEQAYAAIRDKTLPPEIGDPAITARLILERIRLGTFDESMDSRAKLDNWADKYTDRVVVVYGFHMNKSTFEDAEGRKGVYAVVEIAVPPSGEIETVQTGGANVLTQLVKAWEERRFPFQAVLTSTGTGSGNTTYWLKRPEKV